MKKISLFVILYTIFAHFKCECAGIDFFCEGDRKYISHMPLSERRYVSARSLHDSHNKDTEFEVAFDQRKVPIIRCSKSVLPGDKDFAVGCSVYDVLSSPSADSSEIETRLFASPRCARFIQCYKTPHPVATVNKDFVSDHALYNITNGMVYNVTESEGRYHFNLMAHLFQSGDGRPFLRLPIKGVDSLCSIFAIGLNPKRIDYLHPYESIGIKMSDPVWQQITNDFSLNVIAFDEGNHVGSYDMHQAWNCSDPNAKDLLTVYISTRYVSQGRSHANAAIPLTESLEVPDEYKGLFRKIIDFNFIFGGSF